MKDTFFWRAVVREQNFNFKLKKKHVCKISQRQTTTTARTTATQQKEMNHHGRRTGSRQIDTTNEEWSDITSVDGAVEASSAKLRLDRHDTNPTPTLAEFDLVNKAPLEQDAKSLKNNKQNDHPFLLDSSDNSIRDSSARRFSSRPVKDMHQLAQEGLRRNCVSYPASIQTTRTSDDSSTPHVQRCRRVSFEYHADSLLDDLFESCGPTATDESVSRLMGQSRRRKVMLQLLLLLKCQATQSVVGVEKPSKKIKKM